jgi:hypothetical protein
MRQDLEIAVVQNVIGVVAEKEYRAELISE